MANPRPVKVAFWFKPNDAKKLWDLASRHVPDTEDFTWFAVAARSTERGMSAVLELEDGRAVHEAVAFFVRHGIETPTVDDLSRGFD